MDENPNPLTRPEDASKIRRGPVGRQLGRDGRQMSREDGNQHPEINSKNGGGKKRQQKGRKKEKQPPNLQDS